MSGETSIEWATHVWNPTKGCDRVSPGCDHCYAMTMAKRLKGMGSPEYQRDGDPRTSGPGFLAHESPSDLYWPLRKRKPMRVFVNSMSDLFHDKISDAFIAYVFAVMALAPQHTFQVLTKRHARMRSLLSSERFRESVALKVYHHDEVYRRELTGWPLPNVWLGVSVESQQWADIRIPALLDTPAAVRFLSCEPLLGPIDLDQCGGYQAVITPGEAVYSRRLGYPDLTHIDWVICGGESGPGARPMHPDWARSLRDQCVTAVVPFLFKQWGEWAPGVLDTGTRKGLVGRGFYSDGLIDGQFTGEYASMSRVGKKAAGRELDGRTWDEYPAESFPREYPEVTR